MEKEVAKLLNEAIRNTAIIAENIGQALKNVLKELG